jgi:hypothetical protein
MFTFPVQRYFQLNTKSLITGVTHPDTRSKKAE